jgi:hypothetical protein
MLKSNGLVLCGLLAACGGRAHEGSGTEPPSDVGGSAAVGGAGSSGGAMASSGTGGGLAASGSGGAIELGPEPQPPMQIAGRWAQFGFEDPVGVRLTQTNGSLVGEGCAAGAPPLEMEQSYCGAISGKVIGNQATFGFPFEGHYYQAETVISADGQRMTGRFHGVSGWLDQRTAWLRVADDAYFLDLMGAPDEPVALADAYLLDLEQGDGDEYQRGVAYRVHYSRRALHGALGSFWGTEATDPALGSPIRVGPVPATSAELPVDLSLDFAEKGLTAVRATTASGHRYSFRAQRETP